VGVFLGLCLLVVGLCLLFWLCGSGGFLVVCVCFFLFICCCFGFFCVVFCWLCLGGGVGGVGGIGLVGVLVIALGLLVNPLLTSL